MSNRRDPFWPSECILLDRKKEKNTNQSQTDLWLYGSMVEVTPFNGITDLSESKGPLSD